MDADDFAGTNRITVLMFTVLARVDRKSLRNAIISD